MNTFLAVAFIIFVFIWPLGRYAGFFLSNYRAGSLAAIRSQLGGLAVPILKGVALAIVAEIIAVSTYVFGFFQNDKDVQGTPVVLVHGLFHNSAAWLVMKRRLRKAGFQNLHTYQYNSFSRGFDQAVDGLEKKLDQLLVRNPDRKIMLVGHSLGGLVCRKVAGEDEYRDKIEALVALGSPHKGSELAWGGGNTMSRGLIPGRAIPRAIEAVQDSACPKLAVYTLVDDFVFPLEMLRPGHSGWEEHICSPMSHVWLLYSREVADVAIGFLHRAKS